MATIKRRSNRGNRWEVRYRDPDGKQRNRLFDRKVDAERFAATTGADLARGVYVDQAAGRVTFRAFAEEWRANQLHRSGTAQSAEQHLRLHVYPVIGDRPIATIRPSDLQALVRRLDATLAPSTTAVVYGRVVAVFRAAARDRIIATSPCIDVRLPARRPASMLEVLTGEQVHALADAVPGRYRGAVLAGAGLGLRPGELFGLTVDRVDFLRRSVRVDQQLARVRRPGVARVELAPLKTQASYRTIPLPDVVASALAAHLAEWPAHGDLGVVFTNERGGPIQGHPFAAMWETAAGRAELPEWATPHDLRHYYASALIRGGASVKVIQARLGHASAKTSLDTYGHLFPDEEDRTRAAVDLALGSCAPDVRQRGQAGG